MTKSINDDKRPTPNLTRESCAIIRIVFLATSFDWPETGLLVYTINQTHLRIINVVKTQKHSTVVSYVTYCYVINSGNVCNDDFAF